ncbi:type II toxin-antitoxin system RelB/DinJ family antitoxin [Hippea sp. KM1]|uniref:type II toxin-antitoxin system RelB/DinJ family antitoxin n=1 Tax=Hippea sp. KM1 TaxID=944481 RepID=UPI00046D86FF|nr:type II toxin-antitoxin system RelB/DinJ family antitoxin [Hippea sp. KM1]
MSSVSKERIRTNLSLDKEAKEKARKIFEKYGLSLSEAVNIFLYQSIYSNGIPFRVEIPNEETVKAMENVRKGENLEEVTLDQLKEEAKQCLK